MVLCDCWIFVRHNNFMSSLYVSLQLVFTACYAQKNNYELRLYVLYTATTI